MDAEQRAREIDQHPFTRPCHGGPCTSKGMADLTFCVCAAEAADRAKIIATLLSAESAAYERAAKVAETTKSQWHDGTAMSDPDTIAGFECAGEVIATAIRALKKGE